MFTPDEQQINRIRRIAEKILGDMSIPEKGYRNNYWMGTSNKRFYIQLLNQKYRRYADDAYDRSYLTFYYEQSLSDLSRYSDKDIENKIYEHFPDKGKYSLKQSKEGNNNG